MARASIFARVTDGNRLARGTCRLSKFSSQKPEMSGLVLVSCAARPTIVMGATARHATATEQTQSRFIAGPFRKLVDVSYMRYMCAGLQAHLVRVLS